MKPYELAILIIINFFCWFLGVMTIYENKQLRLVLTKANEKLEQRKKELIYCWESNKQLGEALDGKTIIFKLKEE